MAAAKQRKITATKSYRLFGRSGENRPVDLKKHKKLYDSMRRYGFLSCFPIVCVRDDSGNLVVKDGQHRLAIAEELGLPVFYVIEDTDFDVAVINCTPKPWTLRDYAQKFAENGVSAYREGIEFAEQHGLPIGTAFALLGGTTTFSNIQGSFIDGTLKMRDREWADAVASVYCSVVTLSRHVSNARFIEACMAACRVEEFDIARMIRGAERCREKLVSYSTRDAYLDMMEEVYNYGRKQLVALKVSALQAMRNRNAVMGNGKKK